MKHVWKMLLAAMLALMLLLCVTGAAEEAEAATVYGMSTADQVRVRKQPSTSANMWFYIDEGFVAEILGETKDGDGNVTWYKVNSTHPVPNGRTYIGYVHADFFRPLTAQETADYLAGLGVAVPTDAPTTEPDAGETDAPGTDVSDATGVITAGGVNFRQGPSTDDTILAKLAEGTEVEILTIPDQIGSQYWYRVRYNGEEGYVQSNYIRVTSGGTQTDAPSDPGTEEDTVVTATGVITADGVNFRVGPGMQYGTMGKLNSDTVVELLTIPDQIDSNHWYCVRYNGQEGYIQAPYIRVLTLDESYLPETAAYGYAKLVKDSANLRAVPGGSTVVQWKGRDSLLRIVGEAVKKGSFMWYPVYFNVDSTIYYVRGDMIEVVNVEGGEAVTPTPAPESGYGYIITTESGVNLRIKPAGESVAQVPRNTILACVGKPVSPKESGTSYTWYYVKYEGMYGYLRGDCVRVCTATGGDVAATPTPEPDDEPTQDVTVYGYIKLIKGGVNLRVKPAGTSQIQLPRDLILPVTGDVVPAGEYGRYCWYPVRTADGMTGYIRGDCAMWCDADGDEVAPTPTPTPAPDEDETVPPATDEETPAPGETLSSYVMITHNKVNLRKSYSLDSDNPYQVNKGTVVPLCGYKDVGTVRWYNIVYKDIELWVHGSYAKVMTVAEYEQWLAANPDEAPDVTANLGYLKLVMDKVYVRNAANGSTIVDQLAKGTVIRYYSEPVKVGDYGWYRVLTPDGEFGYIRSDTVEKCDQNGDALATTPPTTGDLSSAPDSQQETDYSELSLGDSGTAVANLVAELINQGYYTGSQTSDYTSAVQAAVKAFQSVNGLTVDGIAGDKTQHKLFGTKPIGSGNTSNLDFAIYPVEKIDWFTGGIQQLIPRGSNFKVYDVKTGIVWWAHRWAGGSHADIETLTAADSARLCQIYGVNNLQEIVDKNLWQRRPCLVTIGTRTFACSLDGMQHGTDTIANNGMDGQICLHFTNSRGHESGAVSTSHAEAIEYAYNNCPAGQKK